MTKDDDFLQDGRAFLLRVAVVKVIGSTRVANSFTQVNNKQRKFLQPCVPYPKLYFNKQLVTHQEWCKRARVQITAKPVRNTQQPIRVNDNNTHPGTG